MDVKNHVILYPREDLVPDDVVKLDVVQARARLFEYVREMVPRLKGKIAVYDVMNEPFGSLLFQQKFGADRDGYYQMLADLYKEVKRLDPQAKLFLNDAGQESPEPRRKFLNFARELLKRGAPIDGYGVQFHIGSLNPTEALKAFNELSKDGQVVSVSEFDTVVSTKRTPEIEAYQADLLRDLLTVAFSHPKVDHFIMWGFWDGDHWLGNGPLYNLDWSVKSAHKVWQQLVLRDWWTRAVGTSNTKGEYSTRGFFGNYTINVTANGKTQTVRTKLAPGAQPLTIKLAS
jgi:GH35 family endo-1,4-beta-xylanase